MKLKKSLFTLFSALTATSLGFHSAPAVANDDQTPSLSNALAHQLQYVLEAKERYIVKFRNTPVRGDDVLAGESRSGAQGTLLSGRFNQQAARSAVNQVAGRIHKVMDKRSVVVASMDSEAVRQLRLRPDVESISPDPIRTPMSQTVPYSYSMINALTVAQPDTTARKVCVIDTGISAGHEDLPDQNNGLTGSTTGSAVGDWFNDGYGHGTHVAGTIAAYDNNYGSVGVYPGVNLHVVKVFDDAGSWTYASNLVEAIDQCAQAGAQVVNMSLGGPGDSNYENQALAEFEEQGILMVAAAGNDGNGSKAYPASYDSVISVAAVGTTGNRAGYSQFNDQVEIAAPGTRIFSTRPGNNYTKLSGTSMATPHVAGGAALVWSFFPQCTNAEIRTSLNATALDKGDAGRDDYYGYGLLQVSAAYERINTMGCSNDSPADDPATESATVEKTELTASTSGWNRYTVSVPEGASAFSVAISGGTGNADLYVKQGYKPRYSSYDCRPFDESNDEICTFDAPAPGEWHIGVRARTAYTGVTMQYTIDAEQQTEPEPDPVTEPVEFIETDLAASTNKWKRFVVTVPEGMTTFSAEISGGTGDADLYVRLGAIPKYRSFDCRAIESDNSEICTFDAPAAGNWHIGVRADQSFDGVTLKYSYQ